MAIDSALNSSVLCKREQLHGGCYAGRSKSVGDIQFIIVQIKLLIAGSPTHTGDFYRFEFCRFYAEIAN